MASTANTRDTDDKYNYLFNDPFKIAYELERERGFEQYGQDYMDFDADKYSDENYKPIPTNDPPSYRSKVEFDEAQSPQTASMMRFSANDSAELPAFDERLRGVKLSVLSWSGGLDYWTNAHEFGDGVWELDMLDSEAKLSDYFGLQEVADWIATSYYGVPFKGNYAKTLPPAAELDVNGDTYDENLIFRDAEMTVFLDPSGFRHKSSPFDSVIARPAAPISAAAEERLNVLLEGRRVIKHMPAMSTDSPVATRIRRAMNADAAAEYSQPANKSTPMREFGDLNYGSKVDYVLRPKHGDTQTSSASQVDLFASSQKTSSARNKAQRKQQHVRPTTRSYPRGETRDTKSRHAKNNAPRSYRETLVLNRHRSGLGKTGKPSSSRTYDSRVAVSRVSKPSAAAKLQSHNSGAPVRVPQLRDQITLETSMKRRAASEAP